MRYALGVVLKNIEDLDSELKVYIRGNKEFSKFIDETDELTERFAKDSDGYQTIVGFIKSMGYSENNGRYGYYHNPLGKMFSYELGGQWRGSLLVKIGVECVLSKSGILVDNYPVLEGYRWVDIARIKDIAWDKRLTSLNLHAFLDLQENWTEFGENDRALIRELIEKQDPDSFLAIVEYQQ